jgi:Flp pilus assembly protein TadG
MQDNSERLGPGLLKTSLRADQSGMALIYVTILLPIIMGFALLAIDGSRVYILNSSLQHGADAIALAMAAELDHTSDAITRAVRAKDNLVSNPATFSESFSSVSGSTVSYRFLNALPANDKDPIPDNPYKTTDPVTANYVEVTVNQATYDTIFPASFINAVGSFTTTASAVAGMQAGACNIVPMFMCNPIEPIGNTDAYRTTELMTHVNTASERRKLFELKAFPNSGQAQFSPGNFGYVETPLGSGGRALSDAISQAVPGSCVTLNGLTTKPGNTNVASSAFNVRFDMYGGSFKKDDSAIRPARNVRKSYTPAKNGANKQCNPAEVTDLYTGGYSLSKLPAAMGFPRDSCMVNNTCGAGAGGRIGGGDWNGMFNLYMTTNFTANTALWPLKDAANGTQFDAANLPSRYEVYLAEKAQNKIGTNSMAAPACYTGATAPNELPDRRLIFAAIANCRAQPIGSGSTTINAAAFGLFFLSEPVGTQGSVYAELVNIVKPGSGSGSNGAIVADNVQLYR